jgi:hypothetical protein
MKPFAYYGKVLGLMVALYSLKSCVKDRDFSAPKSPCIEAPPVNASYADVKGLYVDQTIQIQEELIIEGYVSSSDREGNFFSVLYFQDSPTAPSEGFQIEVDLRDSHLFFPVGQRIFIKTKGLYLGKSKDILKLGGVFNAFGNTTVGRLPATAIADHIFTSCEDAQRMEPLSVDLAELQKGQTNILVRLDRVEVAEEGLGGNFAVDREETVITLQDCNDQDIGMVNSGFSDFFNLELPQGSGSMVGVLLRENDDYFIAIRGLADLALSGERCEEVITEFTSDALFISELADPDNNADARFVELYHAGEEALPLTGWELIRYTNANTEISSRLDLTGHTIPAQGTFVISPNGEAFTAVYGFAPDLAVGTNSPVDSNGDDNLMLVDPFGQIIDAFGRIGEDGTGTDHEFEDGRAVRNLEVVTGNPVFNALEWTIYNDSGGNGTLNLPQNAPEDFTPGARE